MKTVSKAIIVTAVLAAVLGHQTTQSEGANTDGTSEIGSKSKRNDITKDSAVTRESGDRSTGKAPLPPADTVIFPTGVMPGGASSGSMGIRASTVKTRYPGHSQNLSA